MWCATKSILGPLLFLIYINDLPSFLDPFHSVLYADDSNILITDPDFSNLVEKSNQAVRKLHFWFTENKLVLNKSKTNIILFSLSKNKNISPPPLIKINNEVLPIVDSTKFLGLHLDSNLSWEEHIVTMLPKLRSACFALRNLRQLLDTETLLKIYYAYFHSIASHNIIHWGNSSKISTVFKIQKYAIRIITGSQFRDSCKPLFKKLNILPVPSIYIFEILLFTRKNLNLFENNNSHNAYNTRNKSILKFPLHRTSSFENDIQYVGTKLFNALPADLREEPKISMFRKKIKTKLLEKLFYSVSEFISVNLE